jgi:hypothetical protein
MECANGGEMESESDVSARTQSRVEILQYISHERSQRQDYSIGKLTAAEQQLSMPAMFNSLCRVLRRPARTLTQRIHMVIHGTTRE